MFDQYESSQSLITITMLLLSYQVTNNITNIKSLRKAYFPRLKLLNICIYTMR